MKFDFVDIGTADFNTSADEIDINPNYKILLVEPLKFYLNNIKKHNNILKSNFAIGDTISKVNVFYLDEETILKNQLPHWLKGCNSINVPHHLVLHNLTRLNLDLNLIKSYSVDMITFQQLCNLYDIDSIGQLKVDTEGHDHVILNDVVKKIQNGFFIKTLIFEYDHRFGNTDKLNYFISFLERFNYKKTQISENDMRLDLF